MVDDSSSSLNRIKETQSENTFQPGLEAYTLYINAILFVWNVLWSKSKQKKKKQRIAISSSRHTLFSPTKDKFTIWISGFWKRRAVLFEFTVEKNRQQCLNRPIALKAAQRSEAFSRDQRACSSSGHSNFLPNIIRDFFSTPNSGEKAIQFNHIHFFFFLNVYFWIDTLLLLIAD